MGSKGKLLRNTAFEFGMLGRTWKGERGSRHLLGRGKSINKT